MELAERGLYRAVWSADIIDELPPNLIEDGFRSEAVDDLINEMCIAFPDAEVRGYRSFVDGLRCDPEDRHELAAIRADAAAIVTFSVRDFPAPSVEPFDIEILDPDAFLLDQLDLAPAAVAEKRRQAAVSRRHPKTLTGLVDSLAQAGTPTSSGAAPSDNVPESRACLGGDPEATRERGRRSWSVPARSWTMPPEPVGTYARAVACGRLVGRPCQRDVNARSTHSHRRAPTGAYNVGSSKACEQDQRGLAPTTTDVDLCPHNPKVVGSNPTPATT